MRKGPKGMFVVLAAVLAATWAFAAVAAAAPPPLDNVDVVASCSPDPVMGGNSVDCTGSLTNTGTNAQTCSEVATFYEGGIAQQRSEVDNIALASGGMSTQDFLYSTFNDGRIHMGNFDFRVTCVSQNGHETVKQVHFVIDPIPTSTSIDCVPNSVAVGQATTCTATVTDTSATPTTPTGTVAFTSSDTGGTFTGNPCTLSGTGASASCQVSYTPAASGPETITGQYSHDSTHGASTGSTSLNVFVTDPTSTSVNCSPSTVVGGYPSTCTAAVSDTASSGQTTPTGTVTFASNGPGGFSGGGSCTLVQTTSGMASCSATYTPSSTPATPSRTDTITATYGGDTTHTGSSNTTQLTVISPGLVGSGSFVIGDRSATVGNTVTFWGAQWAKSNVLSGGGAPASFKGFAASTPNNPPQCGDHWTTGPGNSSSPPPSVPPYMLVIVSSSVGQSGSTISGDTKHVVVVKTNSGYGPDPGHAGTGTIIAQAC